MTCTIIEGDCVDVMQTYLLDASVNCCVTSPPYFGLRDYGHAGQIGLEQTPDEYVAKLVEVFREVRRVLRDDGTLWLNLGDSYAASMSNNGGYSDKSTLAGFTSADTKGRIANDSGDRRKINHGVKQKDLLGIPWRVAFALQAPYYTGRIKDERLRYWLAGLVDGEGCLTILETTSPHGSGNSLPPILQVRMCDLAPVQRCAEITGLGNASPLQEPPSHGGNRGSYSWRLNARNAADIARELYPYLLVKKRQAVVLWNHQKIRESYETKRGVKIPASALEKQRALRDIVRKLNASEPVDMPSWLEEPQPMFEPGFYLRSDIVWAKPNPMPESVTDRPTKAHEYLFLLSKSPRYYYDAAAIAEDAKGWNGSTFDGPRDLTVRPTTGRGPRKNEELGKRTYAGFNDRWDATESANGMPETRNRRTVWTVTTKPFKGAHFATFPPDLIEPCVLAGCPAGGTVLDPFGGAGTTGLVAQRHGRNSVLIELNPAYVEMAEQRVARASV